MNGEGNSRQRAWPLALTLVTALALLWLGAAPAGAAVDSKGTDFWLAFPGNLGTPTLSLFITGDTATTGTVAIPGLEFSTPFSVTPGTVSTVDIPAGAQIETSDTVGNLGIHVTALAEVTVYGLNRVQFTTDAYLGLPTDILGTEYIVLGYKNSDVVNGTQFAIVGTADSTTVTITPSVTTGDRTAGVAYTIALNQGQTYQLRNTDPAPADLSGTIITSDKPIAVFGGHQCANIPPGFSACDHVVEELPPTVTWGKNFVTMPLATRLNGDTFRFLASTDGTTVSVEGSVLATLNRGQVFEQIVTGPAQIVSNHPILVAQYSNGTGFDGVTSDPFMMLIPPFEQFLGGYTVTTPASGFDINVINIVAPSAAVGAIMLDGTAILAASFVAIGSSGFKGAQVSVGLGSHTLSGPLPFGAFVYGFADFDSYGYPGGMSLAPVVSVTGVALAPKSATNPVGAQHCLVATVTDQSGNAVVGVRVDFNVTGVNQTAGFDTTDNAGQAHFCYTGANRGSDSIVASVGTISDNAAKTWIAGKKPPGKPPGSPPGTAPTVSAVTFFQEGNSIFADVSYSDPNGDADHLMVSTRAQNIPNRCASPLGPSAVVSKSFTVPPPLPSPSAGTAEFSVWVAFDDASRQIFINHGCQSVTLRMTSFRVIAVDAAGQMSSRFSAPVHRRGVFSITVLLQGGE